MKQFKNVKSIGFKVIFEGQGCVNYDSPDQMWTLKNAGLTNDRVTGNVSLAKKQFLQPTIHVKENGDEEIKNRFLYKVSNECLRHEMYKGEMEFSNALTAVIPQILLKGITQPALIERGYMYASQRGTIKKKSPFSLTSAVEIGVPRSFFDMGTHSKAGRRDETSFYAVENVGKFDYESTGFIDLTELQFISGDTTYDRPAVLLDGGENEKFYLDSMRGEYNDPTIDFKFYCAERSLGRDEWAERGILLNKDIVSFLAKDILKRIMNINIWKNGAYLKFKTIDITINYIGEDGYLHSEEIKNVTPDVLNNCIFYYYQKYLEADEERILANRKLADELKEKSVSSSEETEEEAPKKKRSKK